MGLFQGKYDENIGKAQLILQELEEKMGNLSFSFKSIRVQLENQIRKNPKEYSFTLKKGVNLRLWIYNYICNTIGNALDSGKYHVYRGVLNSAGNDLYNIYVLTLKLAVSEKFITEQFAQNEIKETNDMIKSIG